MAKHLLYLKGQSADEPPFCEMDIKCPLKEGESVTLIIDGKEVPYRVIRPPATIIDVNPPYASYGVIIEEMVTPLE